MGLVRAIGRWTLAALVLNSVIGSGIFGMPKDVARLVGTGAPFAYLIAAAGIGVIMACFAEVASQFREAGGPYLYARAAFGQFAGIQMGWMALLVRFTSVAANANLLVIYLGEFWPGATSSLPRAVILTAIFGGLATANIFGVKSGAHVSNFFTVAKIVPLGIFIVTGLVLVGGQIPAPVMGASAGNWGLAVLALVFAYGGFEAALVPMGEVKSPRRDVPFALFMALGTVTAIYMAAHLVVMAALPDPSASARPIADAARVFLGPAGASFVAVGAMISTFGLLSANMISAPRLPYALAEKGDFPGFFAAVHPRFRTPYISIVIYAVMSWILAVSGSFIWNAILSAVGRLFTYGLVCAALLQLRRKQPEADAFRLKGGAVFAVLGLAFAGVLVSRMGKWELVAIAATVAVAAVNWGWARRRRLEGGS